MWIIISFYNILQVNDKIWHEWFILLLIEYSIKPISHQTMNGLRDLFNCAVINHRFSVCDIDFIFIFQQSFSCENQNAMNCEFYWYEFIEFDRVTNHYDIEYAKIHDYQTYLLKKVNDLLLYRNLWTKKSKNKYADNHLGASQFWYSVQAVIYSPFVSGIALRCSSLFYVMEKNVHQITLITYILIILLLSILQLWKSNQIFEFWHSIFSFQCFWYFVIA